MKNITMPRAVSFETALQNLAARLTGTAAADLPKTQEAIVQYMAENIPTVDELAEAITQEVLGRLATPPAQEGTGAPQGGAEDPVAHQDVQAGPGGTEPPEEPDKDALDIVDGRITAESLKTLTNANLAKLAEALGTDVSKCKNKADFVAVLAQVEVQTKTTE